MSRFSPAPELLEEDDDEGDMSGSQLLCRAEGKDEEAAVEAGFFSVSPQRSWKTLPDEDEEDVEEDDEDEVWLYGSVR